MSCLELGLKRQWEGFAGQVSEEHGGGGGGRHVREPCDPGKGRLGLTGLGLWLQRPWELEWMDESHFALLR